LAGWSSDNLLLFVIFFDDNTIRAGLTIHKIVSVSKITSWKNFGGDLVDAPYGGVHYIK
jgi:hypothetical protein